MPKVKTATPSECLAIQIGTVGAGVAKPLMSHSGLLYHYVHLKEWLEQKNILTKRDNFNHIISSSQKSDTGTKQGTLTVL